jgi:hypothetical protein
LLHVKQIPKIGIISEFDDLTPALSVQTGWAFGTTQGGTLRKSGAIGSIASQQEQKYCRRNIHSKMLA